MSSELRRFGCRRRERSAAEGDDSAQAVLPVAAPQPVPRYAKRSAVRDRTDEGGVRAFQSSLPCLLLKAIADRGDDRAVCLCRLLSRELMCVETVRERFAMARGGRLNASQTHGRSAMMK